MSVKVKLSELIHNLDGVQSEDFYVYLNRSAGECVMVSAEAYRRAEDEEIEEEEMDEELREALAIIDDEDDIYIRLPEQYEINEYSMMEDFCYEIKEPKIQNILQRAIQGKGAFRRFKDAVYDLGIEDGWYNFREQKFKEFAKEWCAEHQIEYIDDMTPKKVASGEKLKEALHVAEQVKPGRYRHYKGKEYEVIAVAKHSETMEDYVVYRALYGDGGYWVRPKAMFIEKIVAGGKILPRFEYLGDAK